MANVNRFGNIDHQELKRKMMLRQRAVPGNFSAGETPINVNKLPFNPVGGNVYISDEVAKTMELLDDTTKQRNVEISFLLYGKNVGQDLYINDIDFNDDVKSWQSNVAPFNNKLVAGLDAFIKKSKKDGTDLVVHGHTHPKIGSYYNNFSEGDMDAYAKMRSMNPAFASGEVVLTSCLLVDGNYNFLFFDGNDYYKFKDVFVHRGGRDVHVPSYTGPVDTRQQYLYSGRE